MSVTINLSAGTAFSDPQSGAVTASTNSTAILDGDTLVLCFATRDSRVTVAGITDTSGNQWKQVSGAYATAGDYDGGPTWSRRHDRHLGCDERQRSRPF